MSDWNALPVDALWYGEIIFQHEDRTDYNYGYSADMIEPDPLDIPIPEGSTVIDTTVTPVYEFGISAKWKAAWKELP